MHWCGDGNKYTQQQQQHSSVVLSLHLLVVACSRSVSHSSCTFVSQPRLSCFTSILFFCCCSLASLCFSVSLPMMCVCAAMWSKVRSLIIIGWLQAILFRIWFSRKHWASICCWMSRYFAFCKWFVIGVPCVHVMPYIHTARIYSLAMYVYRCAFAIYMHVYKCARLRMRFVVWLAGCLVGRSVVRHSVGLLVCLAICASVRVYRQFAGLLRIFNMQLV